MLLHFSVGGILKPAKMMIALLLKSKKKYDYQQKYFRKAQNSLKRKKSYDIKMNFIPGIGSLTYMFYVTVHLDDWLVMYCIFLCLIFSPSRNFSEI